MQWISIIASCLLVESSFEPDLVLPRGTDIGRWMVPTKAFSHYMHCGTARDWRMKT